MLERWNAYENRLAHFNRLGQTHVMSILDNKFAKPLGFFSLKTNDHTNIGYVLSIRSVRLFEASFNDFNMYIKEIGNFLVNRPGYLP